MNFLGSVWDWFTNGDNWSGPSGIPNRLWEHIWVSGASILVALVIGLPVGLYLGHTRRFGTLAINVANVGRAIPSFGLLIIGAQVWGIATILGLPKAALLALVALALPPIITNTYVGMAEVPATLRDAAAGMGLTGWQSLRKVELPAAAPLVFAGIRIATLQVVATAGLAAVVGVGTLGEYIYVGFNTHDYPQVFAGALLAAGLALTVEGMLAVAQRATVPKGLRLANRT
jgi:osmoprotectant transport system permease protein